MTRTAGLSLPVVKEVRALALAWFACLVTMIAAAAIGAGLFRSLGVAAYFFGAAALGAASIGHEYNHRTLAMLLAQPARRDRLLLAKLGVLLAMLLSLAAVAAAILFFNSTGALRGPRALLQSGSVWWAMWLPVLGGMTVAPWLTMLSRNPIAGTVFTVGIPGLLWVGGDLIGMAIYGRFAPEVFDFRRAFFQVAALGLCALGAVMSWRMFMRLEAIDGRDPDLRLPAWVRSRTSGPVVARVAKSHPLWLVVKKEIHLQGMAFVVAGIYVLGWLAKVSLSQPDTPAIDTADNVLTVLYAFLTALLIGALASAEERHHGTLEWQVMLPVATAAQWIVKVVVVVALTAVLGAGLPLLLGTLDPVLATGSPFLTGRGRMEVVRPMAVALMMLFAVGGLYVSSLCSSGIQALLVAVASVPGVALFISILLPIGMRVFVWTARLTGNDARPYLMQWPGATAVVPIACIVVAMLWFALVNHRSAERGAGRVVRQVIWIAVSAVIGVTIWAGLAAVIR